MPLSYVNGSIDFSLFCEMQNEMIPVEGHSEWVRVSLVAVSFSTNESLS